MTTTPTGSVAGSVARSVAGSRGVALMPPDQGAAEIASVPASRALVWYGDAMRLWKRGPVTLSMLAVLTVLAQVAFELVPDVGPLAAKIVVPLIACGMLYGAASGTNDIGSDTTMPAA